MTVLSAEKVSAGYGGKEIISDISFSVCEHSVVGLLGTNGCGKTTLLKALCGIIPCSGSVSICGKDIKRLSAKEISRLSSYIPQRSGISIDISALDAVLMGFNPELGLLEAPNSKMYERAGEMLSFVGLHDKAEENYLNLSEGQKQLCILARSLVRDCSLLIMDEPESALDFGGRYRMLDAVKKITEERSCSALITLHDPQLALNTCTEIMLMQDGRIISVIHPEKDSTEEIEKQLENIYGKLSVLRCTSGSGTQQLVLIKE